MAEYLIIKREQCAVEKDGWDKCPECGGVGYIQTVVSLLEVLAKVRWGEEIGPRFPDGSTATRDRQFDNVRIEE